MRRITLLSMFAMSVCCGHSSEPQPGGMFSFPESAWKDPETIPVERLIEMKVDPDMALTPGEFNALLQLFSRTYRTGKVRSRTDFNISTTTPIYLLLKRACPEVAKFEGGGGHIIFVGDIARRVPELKQAFRSRNGSPAGRK